MRDNPQDEVIVILVGIEDKERMLARMLEYSLSMDTYEGIGRFA